MQKVLRSMVAMVILFTSATCFCATSAMAHPCVASDKSSSHTHDCCHHQSAPQSAPQRSQNDGHCAHCGGSVVAGEAVTHGSMPADLLLSPLFTTIHFHHLLASPFSALALELHSLPPPGDPPTLLNLHCSANT